MPTEINRQSLPAIEPAGMQRAAVSEDDTPDASSFGLMPLAIAGILAFVLHIASGVILERSHTGAVDAALDDGVTCPAEQSPRQALPYD